MRRGLLLVTMFLIMKLRCSQSRCEEPQSRKSISDVGFLVRNDQADIQSFRLLTGIDFFYLFISKLLQTTGLDNLKRNILKRYSDFDYDSFVGLMGRRNAGEFSFHLRTQSTDYIIIISIKKYQCR